MPRQGGQLRHPLLGALQSSALKHSSPFVSGSSPNYTQHGQHRLPQTHIKLVRQPTSSPKHQSYQNPQPFINQPISAASTQQSAFVCIIWRFWQQTLSHSTQLCHSAILFPFFRLCKQPILFWNTNYRRLNIAFSAVNRFGLHRLSIHPASLWTSLSVDSLNTRLFLISNWLFLFTFGSANEQPLPGSLFPGSFIDSQHH
jgi:hypothetical protein